MQLIQSGHFFFYKAEKYAQKQGIIDTVRQSFDFFMKNPDSVDYLKETLEKHSITNWCLIPYVFIGNFKDIQGTDNYLDPDAVETPEDAERMKEWINILQGKNDRILLGCVHDAKTNKGIFFINPYFKPNTAVVQKELVYIMVKGVFNLKSGFRKVYEDLLVIANIPENIPVLVFDVGNKENTKADFMPLSFFMEAVPECFKDMKKSPHDWIRVIVKQMDPTCMLVKKPW